MPRRKNQPEIIVETEETVVVKKRGRPPKKSTAETEAQVKSAAVAVAEQKSAVAEQKKTREKSSADETKSLAVKRNAAARKNGAEKTEAPQDNPAEVAAETTVVNIPAEKQPENAGQHAQPEYSFNDLTKLSVAELYKLAERFSVANYDKLRYDSLVLEILRAQAVSMGYSFGSGTLEIKSTENGAGFGFLRPAGLLPGSEDIYVSASQIRRLGLRNGDVVWGVIRPPRDGEQFAAILRVENVNYTDPELARERPVFEKLTPVFPSERFKLEREPYKVDTRIVDLFAPIGKGQRALIVSPPKAGKTTLLKHIANAITANHPEVILMVLLIDERPEEVTDMKRSVNGEVIASTFDRPAEEHIRVASLALDKAKRLAEVGKDVVLLLDSITRLARASNLVAQPSGRTLSGGMDPAALYFPKKFFGAARNIENGGSFTIIGTTLVETGSRMDDVIYEEFKGTGNMEVQLSRKIAEQRIFPALDIAKSSTRRDDLLIPHEDLQRLNVLRRKIVSMDEAEVLNMILEKLRSTACNKEFLATIRAK